jgi:hypothetical protein
MRMAVKCAPYRYQEGDEVGEEGAHGKDQGDEGEREHDHVEDREQILCLQACTEQRPVSHDEQGVTRKTMAAAMEERRQVPMELV